MIDHFAPAAAARRRVATMMFATGCAHAALDARRRVAALLAR